MAKNLVIVESPAKAGTIGRYLGSDFDVRATYGHVRDLLPKGGAVDTEKGFSMNYQIIEKNERHVDAITKAMKNADALYLATDLDREGEAISWHVTEILNERSVLNGKPIYRVVFHEITKRAITEAIENPRSISQDLVNAQQARRALDYLVGFNLSPLLWKKIRQGLSAGRVQSPALRMIVEREEEIERFEAREYWTIESDLLHQSKDFLARLMQYKGDKVKQFSFENADTARAVQRDLIAAANGKLPVVAIEKKQRKRYPTAPFITSTLQQEGVRKLGFTAQKTMRVAQQLYEGVEIDSGSTGLITYMRTDSVSLAQEAVQEIRAFVARVYGADQIPGKPPVYTTKSKNAQEAHEAIRPTSVSRTPQALRPFLSADQLKLYELIWKRTVAAQMKHATIDTVAADLACGEGNLFRATGSTVSDPGFMLVYQEGQDDVQDVDEKQLPPLKKGDVVDLKEIRADQHFTEPPPRYTEASLVKSLEEYGIGRPSTYATIISTLISREYVELDRKRFVPTDVGRIVNKFLTDHFSTYVDYDFTARREDKLDEISRGEKDWIPVMKEFWGPFDRQVQQKEASVTRQEALQARELGIDPKSGKPVSVRMGRFGPFVQIGSKDGDEKPQFFGLRPDQRMDSIGLEDALELAKLPRDLGVAPDGDAITVNIGRYGPYVRYGDKFVSLKKEDDPYSITLERVLAVIAEKKEADAKREIKIFDESAIRILNGRYGPYITDGKKNARVPKDREPEEITLQEAQTLLAEAAPNKRKRGKRVKKV